MAKFDGKIAFVILSLLLSACVTQNFNKNKPVIEKQTSNHELAITRVSLGLGYLKRGNTNQAKFNLEKAKKFGPNMVEVHTAFAQYYETVDEPELTIKSYEKALSIESNNANTLNNYGVFLCRQGRFDKAEKQFLTAITIPSYLLVSESYENLASCQLKADHFVQAEQYLDKAIMHNPNNSSALFQMVRLEYAMGNYKKAHRYERKFARVTRKFKPESLALALKVNQQLGNHKTSEKLGVMLVRMYPSSWQAKQYLLNGLNGLDRIEADKLAERYQQSKTKELNKADTKRVFKLSPNGKSLMSSVKAKVLETKNEQLTAAFSDSITEPNASILIVDTTPLETSVVTLEEYDNTPLATMAKASEKVVSGPISEVTAQLKKEQPITEIAGLAKRAVHVVVKDEILYHISIKYNIKMAALRRWNDLDENLNIRIGDTLFISKPLVVENTDE
jgi:type IV pilus assembly protein PilF